MVIPNIIMRVCIEGNQYFYLLSLVLYIYFYFLRLKFCFIFKFIRFNFFSCFDLPLWVEKYIYNKEKDIEKQS